MLWYSCGPKTKPKIVEIEWVFELQDASHEVAALLHAARIRNQDGRIAKLVGSAAKHSLRGLRRGL